ncbi:MAG: GntR family transcriptional regulator [Pirellulales bacterium]
MALHVVVEPDDPLPLYAQLERAIRLAIASGKLQQGEQLPTVRQLAVDLRINANTVARVYAELERQEVLVTRRGVGTFVADRMTSPLPRRQRAIELRALVDRFLAEAAGQGFAPQEVLEQFQRLVDQEEKTHARRQ